MTSSFLDQPLRSPEQIMDARRAKHPEYLTRIHQLLEAAEELAGKIADDHDPFSDVAKSFDDLDNAISDLRANYLVPADRDLKDWYESWQPCDE